MKKNVTFEEVGGTRKSGATCKFKHKGTFEKFGATSTFRACKFRRKQKTESKTAEVPANQGYMTISRKRACSQNSGVLGHSGVDGNSRRGHIRKILDFHYKTNTFLIFGQMGKLWKNGKFWIFHGTILLLEKKAHSGLTQHLDPSWPILAPAWLYLRHLGANFD